MDNRLKAKVLFEVSQIDKLLENSKPLFDLCKLRPPDFVEMSAVAMMLHSFYNGIEKILVLIFKHYDGKLPGGTGWHMELLDKAFEVDTGRKRILSDDIKEKTEEYLKFRHFVRHSYGFQLEWERMEELVSQASCFWETARRQFLDFVDAG